MNTRSLALTRINSKNHTLNKCQSNSVTENGRAVVQSGAAIRQYALNDNHEPLGKLKGKH